MVKTILNMVPNFVAVNCFKDKVDWQEFSILQPLELLNGENICQNLIDNPYEIQKNICIAAEKAKPNLIEDFLGDEVLVREFEKFVVPKTTFTYDLNMTNALLLCFTQMKVQVTSAEFII